MKNIIALLRITGFICLILSGILAVIKVFHTARQVLFVSLICFAIVILMQVYRFFIRNYFSKGDMYDD